MFSIPYIWWYVKLLIENTIFNDQVDFRTNLSYGQEKRNCYFQQLIKIAFLNAQVTPYKHTIICWRIIFLEREKVAILFIYSTYKYFPKNT